MTEVTLETLHAMLQRALDQETRLNAKLDEAIRSLDRMQTILDDIRRLARPRPRTA
ncbi:hypothetical protein KTD19_12510 [Burkholderia multivorans]|uniref:hypothetical protein n=1 Tax=Burkholderia multivorans TaxID=87883 RepID=UPI0012DD5725|nr:hypothetical protein [Burkholderia multivorans]MBU9233215.1 hypothetical protein [Burkholderia multivorans]QGR95073.1 hypothetical protein FOC30_30115 [Burkholderia multivorans]HEF4739710.1 hypothetical protein [Burkholderia multivorans]